MKLKVFAKAKAIFLSQKKKNKKKQQPRKQGTFFPKMDVLFDSVILLTSQDRLEKVKFFRNDLTYTFGRHW